MSFRRRSVLSSSRFAGADAEPTERGNSQRALGRHQWHSCAGAGAGNRYRHCNTRLPLGSLARSAAPLQDALVHGRADVAQHMLTFRETAEGVCAPQSTWNPRLLTAAAECSYDP